MHVTMQMLAINVVAQEVAIPLIKHFSNHCVTQLLQIQGHAEILA